MLRNCFLNMHMGRVFLGIEKRRWSDVGSVDFSASVSVAPWPLTSYFSFGGCFASQPSCIFF